MAGWLPIPYRCRLGLEINFLSSLFFADLSLAVVFFLDSLDPILFSDGCWHPCVKKRLFPAPCFSYSKSLYFLDKYQIQRNLTGDQILISLSFLYGILELKTGWFSEGYLGT